MIPSPEWKALLEPLQPYFTQPGFRLFTAFVIVCTQIDRRLLVTHVALAGLVDKHFTCFYRFLKEGSWSVEEVGQRLASLVVEKCWPKQNPRQDDDPDIKDPGKDSSNDAEPQGQNTGVRRAFAVIDDTVTAKFGKHFDDLGIHHDPHEPG